VKEGNSIIAIQPRGGQKVTQVVCWQSFFVAFASLSDKLRLSAGDFRETACKLWG
jgi:hypothetical protein